MISEMRCLVTLLGVHIVEAAPNPSSLDWVLVEIADGRPRKLLLLEMTYRVGTRIVVEPTDAEIAACRVDPWQIWNTKRAAFPYINSMIEVTGPTWT